MTADPRWMMNVRHWLCRAGDILLAAPCRFCGEPTDTVLEACTACRASLPWVERACHLCGQPLPVANDRACGACLKQPPPWDHLVAAFNYTEPVAGLIRAFKMHGDLAAGRLLADLLAEQLVTWKQSMPWLLPVPLHPARLHERGFNQALEIARRLPGRRDHRSLRRGQGGPHQRGHDAATRHRQVRNAFHIRAGVHLPTRVAVVDDVITTGATIGAIGKLLRRHGVERIEVYTLARTPQPNE